MTPKLSKAIERVHFSQQKHRSQLAPEVQSYIEPDEFVLADTYGLDEYYVISNSRLLVCSITEKTSFLGKRTQEFGGVQRAVNLDRVTKLTNWSELWFGENPQFSAFGVQEDIPQMQMQVETFEGDVNVRVIANETNHYRFKDPYFFLARVEDAFAHVSEGINLYDHLLYKIALGNDRDTSGGQVVGQPEDADQEHDDSVGQQQADQLLKQAEELIEQGRGAEAAELLKKIDAIYPPEWAAHVARETLRDLGHG